MSMLKKRYGAYPITVDRDHEIQIDDLSSYTDRVKVTRVPYEISRSTLKEILENYGDVENVIMCTEREGKFKGVPIDEAIVWMKIHHPIPSSLWIVETQTNMFFSYDSQPPSCNRCGSLYHPAKECEVCKTTHANNRENAIQLDIDYEDEEEDDDD